MPVIAITREMGSLGKDVAAGLGEAIGVPVIYHELIDQLADRMRVRKSHVIRLLDGKAGLLERMTADKTSLFVHSADEIVSMALRGKGAVIRGWGANHLLRGVRHVVCVRVCAPFKVRRERMLERLDTEDTARVTDEIQLNDEAQTAIMRRHFDVQWTDSEHYDLVLNTQRVSPQQCVDEVLRIVHSEKFAETEASRKQLEDLALSMRVRAAFRHSPEARSIRAMVSADAGRVTLSGCSTAEMLALMEVAAAVQGVRDVVYREQPEDAESAQKH